MIKAAGAVLWREADGDVEIAVVHRLRSDDWSLPKGKLDRGETIPACAARERALMAAPPAAKFFTICSVTSAG